MFFLFNYSCNENLKIFKVSNKVVDIGIFIKKGSFSTYASLSLVAALFFLKNKAGTKTNQLPAPPAQVCFVQTSQPFAMQGRSP